MNQATAKTSSLATAAVLFFVLNILSGCSPAEFRMYNDPAKAGGSLGTSDPADPADPSPTICDPFDPANIISGNSGLKGSIHYLDCKQPRYTKSTDIINHGKVIDGDLFLNQLLVPTRLFSTGFATNDGAPLKKATGEVLVEWFALNLKSSLKLGPGESEGDYQLAILSDDGSTLSLQNEFGIFEPLIENEGAHESKLKCATKVVSMKANSRLPMNLSYFQGPRYHISLILMWRKIADGANSAALSDTECGKFGNEYFFNVGTSSAPATPKKPYQDLLARGWKPLTHANYELQAGSNRCAK